MSLSDMSLLSSAEELMVGRWTWEGEKRWGWSGVSLLLAGEGICTRVAVDGCDQYQCLSRLGPWYMYSIECLFGCMVL